MKNESVLSESVVERIEAVVRAGGMQERLAAFLGACERVREVQAGSMAVEVEDAGLGYASRVAEAAWLDGWRCGRNPELLVFEDRGVVDNSPLSAAEEEAPKASPATEAKPSTRQRDAAARARFDDLDDAQQRQYMAILEAIVETHDAD